MSQSAHEITNDYEGHEPFVKHGSCASLFVRVLRGRLAGQEQLPRFRTGANLVTVDAYFSKDGKPVTDLKPGRDRDPRRRSSAGDRKLPHRAVRRDRARPRTKPDPTDVPAMRAAAADPEARVFVVFLRHLACQLRRIGQGGGAGLRTLESRRRRERSGRPHDAGSAGARPVAHAAHRGDRARDPRHHQLVAARSRRYDRPARARDRRRAIRTTILAGRSFAASRRK